MPALDPGFRRDDEGGSRDDERGSRDDRLPVVPAHAGTQSRRLLPLAAALTLSLTLTACAVGPKYAGPPPTDTPVAFKEGEGAWVRAQPADTLPRGPWWQGFNDPELDRLVASVEVSNQTVAQSAAAYAQARALVAQQRAALLPALTLNAGSTRSESASSSSTVSSGPRTSNQLSIGATWEPDLWGRLGGAVTGAQASAQASQADLAAATLSAQGELATNYLNLRSQDAQIALLQATVAGYERALQIATNRYNAAQAARTDVLQAQTQVANARASLLAQQQQRAVLEHAIAVLTGQAPARFSIAPRPQWQPTVPEVPAVLPSTLLLRRPDVAGAERRVAAANAQIGVAQAAFYPRFTLSSTLGTSAASIPDLFSAPAALWSLGLSGAQLLFNAGLSKAQTEAAGAAYDATVAQYRQSVLVALRQTEDQLAAVRLLAQQESQRAEASRNADQVERQALNRYQAGLANFTEVITAQQTALSARQALVQVQAARQVAAVGLVQALGGGWEGLGQGAGR